MHYATLVIIPEYKVNETNPHEGMEATLSEILANGENDWWDWWVIGGRWTGILDSEYDPEKDPANKEHCKYCKDGMRYDIPGKPEGIVCNACSGTTVETKWPTDWKKHPGDVKLVADLTEDELKLFHHVCIDGWGHFESERWQPWMYADNHFAKLEMPTLDWLQKIAPKGIAIVVDVHN